MLAAVFVTDATVTLLTSMLGGERWYEAHRSHVYQRLSRRWQSDCKAGHRSITLLAAAINGLWLTLWCLGVYAMAGQVCGGSLFAVGVGGFVVEGGGGPDSWMPDDLRVRS